jgi:hypothetical protein
MKENQQVGDEAKHGAPRNRQLGRRGRLHVVAPDVLLPGQGRSREVHQALDASARAPRSEARD